MGFLLLGVEAMPFITSSSFEIVASQATHRSLLPATPQKRGMSRPSLSFFRIRRRTALVSMGAEIHTNLYCCLIKIDHIQPHRWCRADTQYVLAFMGPRTHQTNAGLLYWLTPARPLLKPTTHPCKVGFVTSAVADQ